MDLILFGMQGSGKGTLSKALASHFDMLIFDTGSACRSLSAEDSPLGHKVKEIIDGGNLVENSVIMEIVKDFISKIDKNKAIIFDGIPRSVEQSKTLTDLLDSMGRDYKGLLIDLDEETALKRLTTRKICKKCNNIYPAYYEKDYCEQIIDGQECHGELYTRADDVPEAIRTRIEIFKKTTIPAIETFKDKLIKIDGRPSIKIVEEEALRILTPILKNNEN